MPRRRCGWRTPCRRLIRYCLGSHMVPQHQHGMLCPQLRLFELMSQQPQPSPCHCRTDQPCNGHPREQYSTCSSGCDTQPAKPSPTNQINSCCCNNPRLNYEDNSQSIPKLTSDSTLFEAHLNNEGSQIENGCPFLNVQTIPHDCKIGSSQTGTTEAYEICPPKLSTPFYNDNTKFTPGHNEPTATQTLPSNAQTEPQYKDASCEYCSAYPSGTQINHNVTSNIQNLPQHQSTACGNCSFKSSTKENNTTLESNISKPQFHSTPTKRYSIEPPTNQTRTCSPAPIIQVKPARSQFTPCSKICTNLIDPIEDQNKENLTSITQSKAEFQYQPCESYSAKPDGRRYSRNSTAENNQTLTSNVQNQPPPRMKLCKSYLNNQTSTPNTKFSGPANLRETSVSQKPVIPNDMSQNTCPYKVSAGQPMPSENNSECSNCCPGNLNRNNNNQRRTSEPRDNQTMTSFHCSAGCSTSFTNAAEDTNPDAYKERPVLNNAPINLGDETALSSATCPKTQNSKACECNYPPVFSHVGCTGKITGTCNCEKK